MGYNVTIDSEGCSIAGPGITGTMRFKRDMIVDIFHAVFYQHSVIQQGPPHLYNGVPIHKNPCDLFNYQQIVFEQRPGFIVECGAYEGGSTLFFANLFDLLGTGTVVSIDIGEREGVWHEKVRAHPRVVRIQGSSTDPAVVEQVYDIVGEERNNFVILDSLHTKEHVLQEILSYKDLLSRGNYLIVEDSNLNGHPLPKEWHPQTAAAGGPYEALEVFLQTNDEFEIDSLMEKRFLFSYAPNGYLRKK